MAGRHKRVKSGHPWVYSNEVVMSAEDKKLAPGTIVRLEAGSGEPLGLAMFNPRTLIAARVLDRNPAAVIDRAFLTAKVRAAAELRERLYPGGYYRLIHAEADGLPGLIVDRYGDLCVVQANTAGMDRLLPELIAALEAVVAPATIVLRNDAAARQLEGLGEDVRVIKGSIDGLTEVYEYGAPYYADLREGQKTGWFYDQRDNRARVTDAINKGATYVQDVITRENLDSQLSKHVKAGDFLLGEGVVARGPGAQRPQNQRWIERE